MSAMNDRLSEKTKKEKKKAAYRTERREREGCEEAELDLDQGPVMSKWATGIHCITGNIATSDSD